MSEPALLYEKKDGIAFVTMNRPDVRNAINTEMLVRLADAWQDVNDDPAVHVAILRGAGDKAFCAGADLDRLVRMMQGLRPPETDFDQRVLNDYSIIYKGLLRNYDVYKPIIAQVHGFAAEGDGWKVVDRGDQKFGRHLPINPSGGVLCTNPIGASGMIRLGEAALQAMGRAGAHQVDGVKNALGHAYGGGAQYFAMWVVSSEL